MLRKSLQEVCCLGLKLYRGILALLRVCTTLSEQRAVHRLRLEPDTLALTAGVQDHRARAPDRQLGRCSALQNCSQPLLSVMGPGMRLHADRTCAALRRRDWKRWCVVHWAGHRQIQSSPVVARVCLNLETIRKVLAKGSN